MYGVDLEIIIMALAGVIAVLFVLVIVLFVKLSKLNKKYAQFMAGRDGKSLEENVKENYTLMKSIELKQQQQDLDILDISDRVDNCISKSKMVRYNAFKDMGGKLSFALSMLNDKKDGYILNCMHSNNGSYIYGKEIKHGECEIELSKEEVESINGAR